MNRLVTIVAVAVALALSSGVGRAQAVKALPAVGQALTPKELSRLVSAAKTPAEHAQLSEYFLKLAALREQEAAEYDKLAKSYEAHANSDRFAKRKGASLVQGAQHCRSLAASARKAAADHRALASLHAEAATEAPRP